MKTSLISRAATSIAVLCLAATMSFAQSTAPATAPALSLAGVVESLDAGGRTLKIKADDGSIVTVALAEKGSVMKVAPGEKSLQNAATIQFDGIALGDRVLVRGGARVDQKIDGALRVVVMAKTDLAARDAEDQKAWRERAIVGTVASVNAAGNEFTLKLNAPPGAPASASPAPTPVTLVVDASKASLHRYADTSAKFDDAKPAKVQDIAEGDQLRFLGTRPADGSKATADRVVFGSFKTRALAIEKVDVVAGELSVKDLETNQKFTLALVAGGTIRKIPAEMAAMLGGGAGAGGGRFAGGAGRPGAGAPAGAPPAGGDGASAPAGGMPGRGPGGPGGPGGMGPRGGGRGMADIVDRMPTITLADLKKDDWIGAVVGKVNASGRAVAFNMLAGIEVFASRANRSGGVDVGMPAGLLDGGVGVP